MFRFLGQYVPIKSVMLAITESVLIIASIWAAAWVRLGEVNVFHSELNDGSLLFFRFATVVVVCILCFYYNDLYDLQIVSRRAELLIRLMQALGCASLILALLYYSVPSLMFGRGISAISAAAIGILLVTWRLMVDAMGSVFRPAQRLLIAGTGTKGVTLVREIIEHPELNFKVVGFLDEKGENVGKSLVNPGIIGAVADIEQVVKTEGVHRVVLSFAERRGNMPLQKLLRVKFAGVQVEDAHGLYEKLTGRIMLEMLSPSWLILSDGFRRGTIHLVIKRISDILISLCALMVFSPVLLLTSLAIYLESGAPILFRQERIGLKDRPFEILKFRSMRPDPDKGQVWASHTDQRITRVGRFIRKYRIDEIPQFFNVLRGDMSVVGPRPEQPLLVSMLEEQIPYYSYRHTVRPGITGWAQIKYRYGASVEDAKNKLEYELFYIKHLSLFFDLVIIFRTVQVVLFGKGAI